MSFQDDIQGKNTQLYPVVKIGEDWYSTNNTSVEVGIFYQADLQ